MNVDSTIVDSNCPTGALQPLCKLLVDPKAAAQMQQATASLQNMMKFALWDEIHVPLGAIGKPLVTMIEKGGLAKKMLVRARPLASVALVLPGFA